MYSTARQKFWIMLLVITTFITFIAGWDSTWKMWSVLPFSIFFIYICGKDINIGD
jgi:hypothetical protein